MRGAAAVHREFNTSKGTPERQAMNAVVHCQNTATKNCPNAAAAAPYLGK
jgi:hypothetical protein